MFGRKDKGGVVAAEREPQKAKKASPRDLMIEEINAIEVGKEITFKLGVIYVKPYITIVRNATGKRFVVYQDGKDAAGKPAGKRGKFWDANEAKDIVNWILEREGALYRG
jgi:hypothetical protein